MGWRGGMACRPRGEPSGFGGQAGEGDVPEALRIERALHEFGARRRYAPFLRVSTAAARPHAPFLSGLTDRYMSIIWSLQRTGRGLREGLE